MRSILTAVGVAAPAFAGWPAFPSAQPDPLCTAAPELRLRVGDTLFAVPRDYLPNVYVDTGSGPSLLQGPICQRPEDPPIDVARFSVHVGEHPGFREDAFARSIWDVNVEILSRQAIDRDQREVYERAVRDVESYGARLDDLPLKHGFIAFDRVEQGRHIYIAAPDTITSLDEHPFVMECLLPPLRAPNKDVYLGRSCQSPYYGYAEGIIAHYQYYDGQYPIAAWKDLHGSVRKFIRSMEVEKESGLSVMGTHYAIGEEYGEKLL
jgi:hypothetical protein